MYCTWLGILLGSTLCTWLGAPGDGFPLLADNLSRITHKQGEGRGSRVLIINPTLVLVTVDIKYIQWKRPLL